MGELDIRPVPRVLLRDEPDPEPMAERLMEMYREWCEEGSTRPQCVRTLETRTSGGSEKGRVIRRFTNIQTGTNNGGRPVPRPLAGGLAVIPLKLRQPKMLGGGFHCITLDVPRRGTLQRYFE